MSALPRLAPRRDETSPLTSSMPKRDVFKSLYVSELAGKDLVENTPSLSSTADDWLESECEICSDEKLLTHSLLVTVAFCCKRRTVELLLRLVFDVKLLLYPLGLTATILSVLFFAVSALRHSRSSIGHLFFQYINRRYVAFDS